MDDNEAKRETDVDELYASADFHEILRCTRAGETRIYNIRLRRRSAELWRITETPGAKSRALKEGDFNDSDEVSAFMEEIGRSLVAAGWKQLDD